MFSKMTLGTYSYCGFNPVGAPKEHQIQSGEMRHVLSKHWASAHKVRVVRGTGCVLEDLEGRGTFPLDVDGWGDGVRVGMVFLVVGPGGQRHGGREGPDVSWAIEAVKGLEHFWPAALELLP